VFGRPLRRRESPAAAADHHQVELLAHEGPCIAQFIARTAMLYEES
jgi:hypothetical protein